MADEPEVLAFDPSMKKKKRSTKKPVAAAEPAAPVADEPIDDAEPAEATGEDAADMKTLFGTKKKKKQPKVAFDDDLQLQTGTDADNDAVQEFVDSVGIDLPWAGTDRDYKYEELLGRVFGILTEQHPELSGEKRKHIIRPPQVAREGSKKTVFINFIDICRTMHRHQDHLYQFLLAELGTSGSIDGNYRLVLKGRFQPKGIENVLRRYIAEYVSCVSCKSPDTVLNKENRLYFLHCNSCGASRSVAPIKSGFQAQVGKRRAQKEATAH